MTDPEVTLRQAQLSEIARTRVNTRWQDWGDEAGVLLDLPHGCEFGGIFSRDDDNRLIVSFARLFVPPLLRRAGVANRLVQALSYVAKANAVDSYGGSIESPHMIDLLGKLFGTEVVSYAESRSTDPAPLTP